MQQEISRIYRFKQALSEQIDRPSERWMKFTPQRWWLDAIGTR